MARSISPAPGTDKPVQRGTVSWPIGTQDVTVAPVDWSKATIESVGVGIASTGSAPNWFAEPINATTVRFTHQVGGSASMTVKYQIKEKY